ncbi:chaperone protein dnaJ 16-like [Malus sylvestris]|uniref:chaperone protein dnaJ 16-like n=1 Tax=Malus sylvestris TaxID=3752 RepID=UPI0021ACED5F|nr:chaperone protein dnaJ 16-like [Malus sylvestris]
MALKYHTDKNANDTKAADTFKEVMFSYNILFDPNKRRRYDTADFQAVETESHYLELDLSSLGAVNTIFAALFSKLGMPIKTIVSVIVLDEALNGMVTARPLPLGHSITKKFLERERKQRFGAIHLPWRSRESARSAIVKDPLLLLLEVHQRHNSFLAQIEGAVLDLNRILFVPHRITIVRTPSSMVMAVGHQAITYQGKVLG